MGQQVLDEEKDGMEDTFFPGSDDLGMKESIDKKAGMGNIIYSLCIICTWRHIRCHLLIVQELQSTRSRVMTRKALKAVASWLQPETVHRCRPRSLYIADTDMEETVVEENGYVAVWSDENTSFLLV